MSGHLESAVRIVHYPTNTSAVAVGGWCRPFVKLKKEAMRTLKIRILMASKAIWSSKLVRTYHWDSNFNPEKYYSEFDLDEILRKEK